MKKLYHVELKKKKRLAILSTFVPSLNFSSSAWSKLITSLQGRFARWSRRKGRRNPGTTYVKVGPRLFRKFSSKWSLCSWLTYTKLSFLVSFSLSMTKEARCWFLGYWNQLELKAPWVESHGSITIFAWVVSTQKPECPKNVISI